VKIVQHQGGQRDLDLAILQNAKTRAIPDFDTVTRLDAIEYDVEEEQRGAHAGAEGGDEAVPTVSTAWGVAADLVDDAFYR
jgi:hypothetical protein